MYKSPTNKLTFQKKSGINFIKNAVSPKHPKIGQISSLKQLPAGFRSDLSIDKFKKQHTASVLYVEIYNETIPKTNNRASACSRINFMYGPETLVKELVESVKKHVQEQNINIKSGDTEFDYFLSLPTRKVKEIEAKKIEIQVSRVKTDANFGSIKNFQIIKCIGTGGFSKVYLARGYGRIMALKVIDKYFIIENQKENIIENERAILEKCNNHPFITKLFLSFETINYLVFAMEYCNGGELFNLLRKVRRMSEDEAKFYFVQTLSAISFLHENKILYRDLKPENIIIDHEGHIRLADYGLSKIMKEELTHSFCGSAEYMAPEMLLKKGHSYEIDYYCLGALLYELIFGLPPYYSRSQNELFDNIINKQLEFPAQTDLSSDLKSFLSKLLEKEPNERFKSIEEITSHPWMKTVNMTEVYQKKLKPPHQTPMFEVNYDDSDFAKEESLWMAEMTNENQITNKHANQQDLKNYFKDFLYVSNDIMETKDKIKNKNIAILNFSKKAPVVLSPQQVSTEKQIASRKGSMRNADNNVNYRQAQIESINTSRERYNQNKSQEKLRTLIHQSPPQFTIPKKQSLNISNASEAFNNSHSKLSSAKSVPYIQKHSSVKPHYKHSEKIISPININNYINIYTHKNSPYAYHNSPSTVQPNNIYTTHQSQNTSHSKANNLGYQTNKKGPPIPVPHQHQQHLSGSYDLRNYHSNFKHHSVNNHSLERVKFSSNEKSLNSSGARNNIYNHQDNVTPNQRGYLTNFKERFNPNQKIKKSYKNNQKFSFNFFSPVTPYKH